MEWGVPYWGEFGCLRPGTVTTMRAGGETIFSDHVCSGLQAGCPTCAKRYHDLKDRVGGKFKAEECPCQSCVKVKDDWIRKQINKAGEALMSGQHCARCHSPYTKDDHTCNWKPTSQCELCMAKGPSPSAVDQCDHCSAAVAGVWKKPFAFVVGYTMNAGVAPEYTKRFCGKVCLNDYVYKAFGDGGADICTGPEGNFVVMLGRPPSAVEPGAVAAWVGKRSQDCTVRGCSNLARNKINGGLTCDDHFNEYVNRGRPSHTLTPKESETKETSMNRDGIDNTVPANNDQTFSTRLKAEMQMSGRLIAASAVRQAIKSSIKLSVDKMETAPASLKVLRELLDTDLSDPVLDAIMGFVLPLIPNLDSRFEDISSGFRINAVTGLGTHVIAAFADPLFEALGKIDLDKWLPKKDVTPAPVGTQALPYPGTTMSREELEKILRAQSQSGVVVSASGTGTVTSGKGTGG